jgi:uncharacterized membrane protein
LHIIKTLFDGRLLPSPVSSDTDPNERPQSTGSRDDVPNPRVGTGLLDVEMGPSSALAHLYRGELHRMKLWRERLDRTTNWAVLLLAALLTWAFSNASNPHYIVLVGNLAVGLFLSIEARRYRAYDSWRSRVRSLQENVWAPGLDPTLDLADERWRQALAEDYAHPTLKITTEEALAHRLRRVYLPLFAILNGAWVLRVTAFADTAWPASAQVGPVSGVAVTLLVGTFMLGALVVAVRPRTWHASDELRAEALRRDGDAPGHE